MPTRTPSYRLHKPSGQAVVTVSGKDFYLGRFDTPESHAEYDRLIAEWLSNGRRLPRVGDDGADSLTVSEVILSFWKHAERHYRHPDGTPTSELDNYRLSLRHLRRLYGNSPARSFGPLALKAVRERMIQDGLCRGVINQRVGRIKRMFRWATENELVPASVFHGLQAVRGLQRGRSEARETQPVRPVEESWIQGALSFLLPQTAAMVRLQLLTGMRPGEVTAMRGVDLDMSGPVWFYRVQGHKNAWRGHERVVAVGPKAQEIIKPFLYRAPAAYLFSPREAMDKLRAEQRRSRKTGVQPSQLKRRKGKPKKVPGDRYTVRSYFKAIVVACEKAGVPRWHPHQLRHTRATELRAKYGLDAARVVLGHRSPKITEVYAEIDVSKAAAVMAEIG